MASQTRGHGTLLSGDHYVAGRLLGAAILVLAIWATFGACASLAAAAVSCDRVASPSGSDRNRGTLTSPYRTVQKLVDSLSSGQTGCLRAGMYGSSSTETVFSTPDVTITTYPGDANATLQGRPDVSSRGSGETLSYINFDTNDVGASWPGLCQGAVSGGAIVTYGFTIDASNVTVMHDNVYIDSSVPLTSRGGGMGVGMSNSTSGDVIMDNRIHDMGFCPVEEHGIYLNKTDGVDVHGNWIYNLPAGTGIQVWDGPTNAHIYANVIDNTSSCMDLGGNSSDTAGNVIEHNICSNMTGVQRPYAQYCNSPGPGCTGPTQGAPLFDYWQAGAGSGNVMQNNITYCASTAHCSTSLSDVSGVSTSGNSTANPQFADPNYQTSHNYQIASNSPAATWGLWNGDTTTSTPTTSTPTAHAASTPRTAGRHVRRHRAVGHHAHRTAGRHVRRHRAVGHHAHRTAGRHVRRHRAAGHHAHRTAGRQVRRHRTAGRHVRRHRTGGRHVRRSHRTTSGRPGVPTGLRARGGNGRVTVSWAANAAGEQVTHYNLYRTDQTFAGAWATPTATKFTNASNVVVNGQRYCYQLSATNRIGESAKTAPVCVQL